MLVMTGEAVKAGAYGRDADARCKYETGCAQQWAALWKRNLSMCAYYARELLLLVSVVHAHIWGTCIS